MKKLANLLKGKEMMHLRKHLYTCRVTDVHTKQTTRTYTWAHSHKQAQKAFRTRHPYPPYTITEIKDTKTGEVIE